MLVPDPKSDMIQKLKCQLLDFLCRTILVTTPVATSNGSSSSMNCIPIHLNFGLTRYTCRFLVLGGNCNGLFTRAGITIGLTCAVGTLLLVGGEV